MADPITLMAVTGLALTAAGTGVQAYGQYQSGQAQGAMYAYQAGVAQMNQQIQQENAKYAAQVGEVEAQQSGMKTRALVGETLAKQGASGLDVGQGSPEAVRESEQKLGTYDQAVIRANAMKRAYGYEVEATQEEAQSKLYGMASSQAKTAGKIAAIGTILGGAGSVSSKWATGAKTGVF